VLRALKEDDGARFDLVVLDPPAFIKRRKDEREGTRAYERLNRSAWSCSRPAACWSPPRAPSTWAATPSCTPCRARPAAPEHELQLLLAGAQGPDHPVQPAIAETAYLKTWRP
jgi:23S rRNA (cytosine1962-C5)-methyltransferase